VLRPRLAGADPVEVLPRPGELLTDGGESSELAVQLVFHGVAGELIIGMLDFGGSASGAIAEG